MKQNVKQSDIITAFVKVTGFPAALLFYKPKVVYQDENMKKSKLPKPFILVSNHTSLLDFPLYLFVFFKRNIRFLMAEVLFTKNPFLSRLLYRLGGIFVDRDAFNFGFMGEALEALDSGKSVGVFPQGRLPINGKPFPFKPSAAFIAMHTDALIVPVYTDGNYGIFKRTHVMIGREININELCPKNLGDAEKIEIMTKKLEELVFSLGDELKDRLDKKNAE